MNFFSKNIKSLRLNKGLKQAEICAAIGFSTSAWSEYEHGLSKPRFDDLLKLSAYFEVTLTELVELDLSKLNPIDILELRKMIKKLNPNLNLSLNLNLEKDKNEDGATPVDPAVLNQLTQMEEQLKEMRRKLGQ